ncbi:MAG TPA: hypothetical protein VEA99_15195 [Gemmatimonadaceae bacterium]|nr:hypothetical protein [Gemmatimonadaceae bacterium]
MNVIFSKRISALVMGAVLATAGCGSDSDSNEGGGGGGGPSGFHVNVVLPEELRNGGPAGFSRAVSNIGVTVTLDGVPVTPDEIRWSITDAYGLSDPPAAVTPSPATGPTTSFEIPDFETVRTGANAWLNELYGTADTEHAFAYIQAPEREQLLSFGKQQVSAMSFKVVAQVRSGEHTATGSAIVSPVTVSNGGNTQPLGMMVVGNAPAAETYAWTLTYVPTTAASGTPFGNPPAGVTLQGADTKNPYVVPTVTGVYQLQNGTNTPIQFRVSTYHGSGMADTDEGTDGVSCRDCHHPTTYGDHTLTQFAEWRESAHANHEDTGKTLFELGLSGALGPNFSESSIAALVVGYSKVPTARNGGFDDVMGGWTFPTPAAANWERLPEALKYRAGVQCESCHGPLEPTDHSMVAAVGGYGRLAPAASMDSGICMQCHDTLEHDQGPLWATSPHANTALAILDATVENRGNNASHCGRCHSAEGFALYLPQQQAGTPTNIARPTCEAGSPNCSCTTATPPVCTLNDAGFQAWMKGKGLTTAKVHPVTCQTCHEPHSGELRVNGDTNVVAALFRVQNAGAGATCIVCHNTRSNAVRQGDLVIASWTAPHVSAQGDVFAGRNAFFVPELVRGQPADQLPRAAPHASTSDSCVVCHVRNVPEDVRNQFAVSGSNHTFKASMEGCADCHSTSDVAEFEAHKDEIEHKLHTLEALIESTFLARLNAAGFDAATRYDLATDGDLPAPADPTVAAGVVTAVDLYETHGQPALAVTLADGTRFGTQIGNVKQANTTTNLFAVSTGSGATLAAGADQILAKAVYNFLLIHGDGTEGVHNPGFVDTVLDNTLTQLSPP